MKPLPQRKQSFSLIECVVALGIVAFAFVTLVGLLPSALQQFKTSRQESVQSEVVKYIDTQIQETPFTNLVNAQSAGVNPGLQNGQFGFDDEGFPVATYGATNQVYAALTAVTNGVTVPSSAGTATLTAMDSITVTLLKQPATASSANAQTNAVITLYASNRGQ